MRKKHRRSGPQTSLHFEGLEARRCLSAVSFIEHDVIGCICNNLGAGDIDSDGDNDILTFMFGRFNAIGWHENLGEGRFQHRPLLTLPDTIFAKAAEVTDVDLDGDVDIIVAAYENQGGGSFGPARPVAQHRDGEELIPADFDGDGDTDLLQLEYHREVQWLENRVVGDSNDDGRFDTLDLVRAFHEDDYANVATFEAGDWNHDGKFDSSDLVLAFQMGHFEE